MALENFSDYVASQKEKYAPQATTLGCPICANSGLQNPLYFATTKTDFSALPQNTYVCFVCDNSQYALSNPPV